MARRCTNDGAPGMCCAAFSQGVRSGQAFTATDHTGRARCHVCTVIQRSKGRGAGFQHRFAKSQVCGIVSGCPALATQQPAMAQIPFTQPMLQIGQGGGVPMLH